MEIFYDEGLDWRMDAWQRLQRRLEIAKEEKARRRNADDGKTKVVATHSTGDDNNGDEIPSQSVLCGEVLCDLATRLDCLRSTRFDDSTRNPTR